MHRGTAALAAVLLLATGLAGCLGTGDDLDPQGRDDGVDRVQPLSALTQPIYETVLRTAHTIQGEVQGHETEEIWLDVYRPEAPKEVKVPTILVMTPYQALGDALGAPGAAMDGDPAVPPQEVPYDPGLVDFFVPRGYAVAFADVRGNHNSGGCIDQSGPGQWWDGHYTIEWLASQPWSNGRVGMHGASYDGETQVSTALTNPPHLTTIVPTASVQSQYQYLYYNGVPYDMQGVATMGAYLAISAVPGTDPNAVQTYPERFECQPENFQESLDLSGDWSPYWEDRAYFKLAHEVTNTSVLHIHGLQDWNVKPDHIDPQFNAWTTEKRAIYGQWGHAYPDREDWGGEAGILHRWYDHYLYGIDTGLLDELPPVLVEDTSEAWHAVADFPPTDAATLTLQLSADGALVGEGAETGTVTLHDVPRDRAVAPVNVGPVNRGTERAADAASYAATGHAINLTLWSAPLEEELVLSGRPTLTFDAATDAESTHWVAHLLVRSPDGSVELINRAYQDTRHLDGVDQPAPLEPGEAYRVTLTFFPQVDTVPAGSELGLVITNDDDWVHQDDTYAASTLDLGPDEVLVLPLLPPDAVDVPEDRLT